MVLPILLLGPLPEEPQLPMPPEEGGEEVTETNDLARYHAGGWTTGLPPGVHSTFTTRCNICGSNYQVIDGRQQPYLCRIDLDAQRTK